MNNIETIDVTNTAPQKKMKTPRSTGSAFVGKDIMELVSVSMYVEPLTLYREYIQNAADSIDSAESAGVLDSAQEGQISVSISQSTRSISIRDNGAGISSKKFAKAMLSFGASEKRGTQARGFRGVGRFAGLGYCQQLIFRTKAVNEAVVSEVKWDGRMLKRLLADNSEQLSISDLVKRVAVFSEYEGDEQKAHFFEVELCAVVRIGQDILLNEQAVFSYISQICPIPYSPGFSFTERLNQLLTEHTISTGYRITLESDFAASEQIFRPYGDEFRISETDVDRVENVEAFELAGVHGEIAAIGWIYQHSYKGILPGSENIRGIRVRVGNTQIGEENLMLGSFPEPRFNSWSIGEIHVLEKRLTPNGRRDSFDNNVHWVELQNQFAQHGKEIARICRKNSAERNVIKQFEALLQRIEEYKDILEGGLLSRVKAKEAQSLLSENLIKAENLCEASQLSESVRKKLKAKLKKYLTKVNEVNADAGKHNEVFMLIPKSKHATV